MRIIPSVAVFALLGLTAVSSCAQPSSVNNLSSAVSGSGAGNSSLSKIGQMPDEVKESSGLAPANEPGMYYTQGDAGTEAVLFKIDSNARLVGKLALAVPNKDWESLAHDNSGNLYVCDCGNNSNSRKDLVVYRVNPAAPDKVDAIQFSYPDQRKFPPKKKDRNFDSEASFWHNGNLYLFSRDRGRKQTSKVYRVPATPGKHEATLLASLSVPGEVTGASLSASGKRMALLTKQNIFLYEASDLDGLLKAKPRQLSNNNVGQTEGIDFIDENTLLISTEEGALYKLNL